MLTNNINFKLKHIENSNILATVGKEYCQCRW